MIQIRTYTTDKGTDLKTLAADKIGPVKGSIIYLRETNRGESLYHGWNTTQLFTKQSVSICGISQEIEKSCESLEKLLEIKLIDWRKK